MSDILSRSVTDPHGDKALDEITQQDLSILSVEELTIRIEKLRTEIARVETEQAKRGGAVAAAEALFKS